MNIGTRASIRNNRRVGFILSSLLSLIVTGYSLLYFNNTYPISEGWGINYAELMFHGKIPYRDFYYYLPPLNLLIDAVFWKLSFGSLLVFRGWYLLQRIVLYVSLFRILRRYFDQNYAFVACALTSIIATADVYDLLGDYNQTVALLVVPLMYAAIAFINSPQRMSKLLALAWAGVVIGLMFLTKQTIFAASFAIFFIALTVFCIINKDKDYLWYCLSVAIGVLIPLSIALIYLLCNGALVPFFEQVFLNVSGKGSVYNIFIESVLIKLRHTNLWGVVLLAFALFTNKKQKSLSNALMLIAIVLQVYSLYAPDITAFWAILVKYRSALTACIGSIAIFAGMFAYIRFAPNKLKPYKESNLYAAAMLLCTIFMAFIPVYSPNFANELYAQNNIFSQIKDTFSNVIVLSSITLLVVLFFKYKQAEIDRNKHYYSNLIFISCGGISLLYAGSMTCVTSLLSADALRIALPLLLCCILSIDFKSTLITKVVKICITCLCAILCTACVSQKIACSYSWWGSYMSPRSEKTYTVDIPAMKGIRVSLDQKELYETIYNVITDNVDENAVIWGYPHNKLFNILTERYNMTTFVPVLFYDVTADMYVEKELEMLKENLPDVIVWQYIPYCLDVHEDVFRNGETLKQRDIEAYLQSIIPEKYTYMCTVSDVTVYIRNDSFIDKGDTVTVQ